MTWYSNLVQADQMAQTKINEALAEKLNRNEFDAQMRGHMTKVQDLGKDDERQRRAYEDEAARLASKLKTLIEDFKKNSRFLKHPDPVCNSPCPARSPGLWLDVFTSDCF